MDIKTCKECLEEFKPTSRHLKCPKCRYRAPEFYDLCACGSRKQKSSKTCVYCVDLAMDKNPSWKGGYFYHKKGYTMVRLPNGKYIFEHRLVMQEHLGRPLLESETVHHKNGNKTDNDLKNLELWRTQQPAGQRVSDLINYANSIIALYGDDPTKYDTSVE